MLHTLSSILELVGGKETWDSGAVVRTRHAMVRRNCDVVACFDELILRKAYGISLDNLLREGLGDPWSCLEGG